ncbi:MAG: hypothetical protein CMC65_05215 [Flavobacteriaceae bacterium]|mgnify:FL=1|jgi:hypothetical protein|nr:hypothetical protein [Flavobacteriaceae bacterium]|tara:strand:- start:1050 stop:1394 length:345 start_codon:yes stop_codon:yes gene_type:complete
MKKLFSLVAFAFIMLLCVQNVSAQNISQNQDRPEVIAKNQLVNLSDQLSLTGDQSRTLFRALVTKEVSIRKSELDENKTTMVIDKKKADELFYIEMKKTLTAQQFTKWESSLIK